jgi:hypothetical protein
MDSWLEATSRALDLSLGQTLRVLGIPVARQARLIGRPTKTELKSLADGTGVPASQLASMTLSRYDGTAIELDDRTGLPTRRFPFALGSRGRPEVSSGTGATWIPTDWQSPRKPRGYPI